MPAAATAAWFAGVVEFAGGIALIIGIAVPIAGLLLLLDMLGAIALVHLGAGIFVDQGGYELALVLGASALLIAVNGAGRFSLEQLRTIHRRTVPQTSN